jgi:hypothetical protein
MTHYHCTEEEMTRIVAERDRLGYAQILQGKTKPIQSVVIKNSKIPA